MFQLPDSSMKEIILALEADTSFFPAGALVRLFSNNFTPSRLSVVGDFTQMTNVDVPGYAAVALAMAGTPVRKLDGSWEDLGALMNFATTGSPTGATVAYGWYLTNAGNTTVYGSGVFDAPFAFTTSGDGFNLEPLMNVSQIDGTGYRLTLDMEME